MTMGSMPTYSEPPHGAYAVLDDLSGRATFWLREVPNHGPRRKPFYDQYPGIRRTGVYLIRDIDGPLELYYVGKVVQDPFSTGVTNPNADGIIGRLSGHQNMSGSNVLVRWYQFLHPDVVVPQKVLAGELRDRIRAAAAPRMIASYGSCPPELATAVEQHIIRYGLPDHAIPPILNSPNWKAPHR